MSAPMSLPVKSSPAWYSPENPPRRSWDPDPHDTSYIMDMVYLLKDGEKVSCRSDRHILGLFSEKTWLSVIENVGFIPRVISHSWPGYDPALGSRMFLGVKPIEKNP